MHHGFARAGRFALAFFVMAVFAAVAGLGVSLSAVSLRSIAPSPSPAEIVALRFPSPDDSLPVRSITTFATASLMPVENWEKFDQDALSGMAPAPPPTTGEATSPTASETTEPLTRSIEVSAAVAETAKPEPPKVQAATAPARRVTSHSSNVLNDAQIASIKHRLKLTAEQEQMWPAVEDALRKIVYTKNAVKSNTHGAQASSSPVAYIDPTSAEVRQLKSAALPLIMRLNDEQKREVKMLAYVMGLEAVASQF